jgi:hypothetical protein
VPGGRMTAVALGVRQIAADPQTVTWSATMPAGVRVRPAQGTLRTRLGEDATATPPEEQPAIVEDAVRLGARRLGRTGCRYVTECQGAGAGCRLR